MASRTVFLLAVMCFVSATGEDSAAFAPGDTPVDTPVDDPPVDTPVEDVTDCSSDSDCRTFDDSAVCRRGGCSCSGGFDGRYCIPNIAPSTPLHLRVTAEWDNLNCEGFDNRPFEETLQALLNSRYEGHVECGSVSSIADVNSTVQLIEHDRDLVTTTVLETTKAQGLPLPVLAVTVSTGCDPVQNARFVIRENGVCTPTCKDGYFLTNDRMCYANRVDRADRDDDDGLNGAAVAGVVLCSIIVVSLLVVAAFLFRKNKKGAPAPGVQSYEPVVMSPPRYSDEAV